MMSDDVVCISRRRYEELLRCEVLLDLGLDERELSDECAEAVRKSLEGFEKGEHIEVRDSEHRKKIIDEL